MTFAVKGTVIDIYDMLGNSLLTLYAARGATQQLDPIEQAADLMRTVNGELLNLGMSAFRKYKSIITCKDHTLPALDGVFPGDQVVIDCMIPLTRRTAVAANRTVVPGFTPVVVGDNTWYLPRLTMTITRIAQNYDEYGGVTGWTIESEE